MRRFKLHYERPNTTPMMSRRQFDDSIRFLCVFCDRPGYAEIEIRVDYQLVPCTLCSVHAARETFLGIVIVLMMLSISCNTILLFVFDATGRLMWLYLPLMFILACAYYFRHDEESYAKMITSRFEIPRNQSIPIAKDASEVESK